MPQTPIHFAWRDAHLIDGFRTGVCLHGHTMHSEECLSFLPRYLHQVPGISQVVSSYERRAVDFARAYWTPPLSPASALALERKQVAGLGLRPIVSLTDHDNIDAGMSLQVTADPREVPISVEWTVPYERSILHFGIHNLPPATAREWMARLAAHTAVPDERLLPGILEELASNPEVLSVLNHPFWLEEGVEDADHVRALERLLRECIACLHAFELNGTRPWKENKKVVELAQAYSRPLISGGDRHACEPAACLNLTNARTFSEFASEIRDGQGSLWFMSHYRESMAIRILESARDILRRYPEYPSRERWIDRVFYRGRDGVARPLSTVWQERVPLTLRAANGIVQISAATQLRPALRLFLAERGEALQ